jgi:hypothetical protein
MEGPRRSPMSKGKLRLVIRSKKTARIIEFEVPLMTWYGKVGVSRRRAIIYDYVLDQRQARAVKEARELAERTGFALEVTDLSRQGLLGRILRRDWSDTEGGETTQPGSSSRPEDAPEPQERDVVMPPVSLP